MYEQMMDAVARKFGFEDERTINFFELCENAGPSWEAEQAVRADFEEWMAEPVFLDEEDED